MEEKTRAEIGFREKIVHLAQKIIPLDADESTSPGRLENTDRCELI